MLAPVANGKWALAGQLAGVVWRYPALNRAIAASDENAVSNGLLIAPTGYTVTVAPDPTL
jgi:hypothetical protein